MDDRLFVFGGDAGGAVFLNDVHVLDLGKGKGTYIFVLFFSPKLISFIDSNEMGSSSSRRRYSSPTVPTYSNYSQWKSVC